MILNQIAQKGMDHCRVGSSEMVLPGDTEANLDHCRVGSSEIR